MSGKRVPPPEHRYPPGKSGNPKGRPKGAKNKKPKMRTPALDETIRFPVNGVLKRMRRREAIVRFAQMRSLALQDVRLTALLLEAERKLARAEAAVDYGVFEIIAAGRSIAITNLEAIIYRLGLGRLIYPDHPAQRVALAPELVTLALSRLKGYQLTRDEQKLVVSFTLTPWKVQWPAWWELDLRTRKCRVPENFLAEDDAEWELALNPPPPPPPAPPEPKFIDFEAEMEKEPKWLCKTSLKPQIFPCEACVLEKKKKPPKKCQWDECE